MRISDWSSEVCSSDLLLYRDLSRRRRILLLPLRAGRVGLWLAVDLRAVRARTACGPPARGMGAAGAAADGGTAADGAARLPAGVPQQQIGARFHGRLFRAQLRILDHARLRRRLPCLRCRAAGDGCDGGRLGPDADRRSEEHTSELQSLMRTSSAVF